MDTAKRLERLEHHLARKDGQGVDWKKIAGYGLTMLLGTGAATGASVSGLWSSRTEAAQNANNGLAAALAREYQRAEACEATLLEVERRHHDPAHQ